MRLPGFLFWKSYIYKFSEYSVRQNSTKPFLLDSDNLYQKLYGDLRVNKLHCRKSILYAGRGAGAWSNLAFLPFVFLPYVPERTIMRRFFSESKLL